jgi:uncharacterized protein YjbJ (UPF0337 family)
LRRVSLPVRARMTAEGRAEQAKGDARQAKEKTKDTFKH